MATNTQLQNGLRRGVPATTIPQHAEKFMGAADEVQRAALPAGGTPAPATGAPANAPAPAAAPQGMGAGRANMMGSGSAPIGQGGVGGAPTASAAATRAGAAATAARGRLNSGVGRMVGAGLAVQAIGDSAAEDSTARYAERFGVSEPTGDESIGDMAKFVGLRAGGYASDLGNTLTMGLAGKYLYRDQQPGSVSNAGAARRSAAAGAAPGAAIAPQVAPGAPQQVQTAPAGALTGSALRRVDVPGASPLFTNNPNDPAGVAIGGNLSVAGGGQDQLASMRRAGDLQAEISSMRAGLRDRGDTGAYLRGASQAASLSAGGMSSELQGQINRLANNPNLTAAGVAALNNLTETQQRPGMEAARLAEQGRQADQQADVSLRGQDVTAAGYRSSAATAAASAARARQKEVNDQANADRDFGMRQQEFGAKRENENFTQRETAEKGLTARFESQFTTTNADGKQVVDAPRVAKYKLGVQQFLGTRQAELEQKIAAGSATAAEKAAHQKIRDKGVAALDQEDLATIESQMKLGERAEQTAGLSGGRYVASSNPADFAVTGRKQNLIGSDTLTLRGGGSIREADASFREPGNTVLPNWFKQETNEYDLAKGVRK